ncbi:MAG: DUF3592 domain-containing protein [Umezawaea sp.]
MGGIERTQRKLMKLRAKRTSRLVASVSFGLLLVLFTAGTVWSLSSSDYPWIDGELTADIVTIVVLLALTVLTGLRSRTFGRRADALEATNPARRMTWLPPLSTDGSGNADLETQIGRLRTTSRRSTAVFAAWVGVLSIGVSGFVLLDMTGQRLLDTGKRVAGTVETVHNARRGSSSITVTYVVDGTRRTARIYCDWDSELTYTRGQNVTVVYDLADPERVRTLLERNDSQLVLWATFSVIIVAAGLGIPFSALSMTGWWARYRAVRATGWRKGTAKVAQEGKALAKFVVSFGDGSALRLSAISYTLHGVPSAGEFSDVPIWVGGAAGRMVIILPRGRWSKGMHAVPVKAEGPRENATGWLP